jgi:hypothetical protein
MERTERGGGKKNSGLPTPIILGPSLTQHFYFHSSLTDRERERERRRRKSKREQ